MFMRSVITLAIAATGAVAVPNAQAPPVNAHCNQDNCLRALLNPTRPAVADCSSYLLTTVTPATVTSTATVSATETSTILSTSTYTANYKRGEANIAITRGPIDHKKRQATSVATSIPAYATPCSGAVRYSSACSCISATARTITAATPSTTITVTNTVTTTTTAPVVIETLSVCPTNSFKLQAVGGTFDGQYATVSPLDDLSPYTNYVYVFSPALTSATTFMVDPAGHINSGNLYGNTDTGVDYDGAVFYFNSIGDISSGGLTYATCKIATDKTLVCADQRFTIWQTCTNVVGFGSGVVFGDAVFDTCTAFIFKAVC